MWIKKQSYLFLLILGLLILSSLAGCSLNTVSSTESGSTYDLIITLPGSESYKALINEQGKVSQSIQLNSSDRNIGIAIDRGTILLDDNNQPLQSITVTVDSMIPVSPDNLNMVGMIVDIQPVEAMVKPSLKLTLSYAPSELPPGFNENNLWIYKYADDTWNLMGYKKGDTEANRITTTITSFGKYSILAPAKPVETTTPPSQQSLTSITLPQALVNGKPTLAEFGRGTCIPCQQMKPILEDLAIKYQDKLNVSIVSIDEYEDLTDSYKVMAIPTQIIFDSNGKEVFRHIGFWAKDQIITQLNKLSIK